MPQRFSLIQNAIDTANCINSFKNDIRTLNEKYDIVQETFGIASNGMAAIPARIHEGYMTVFGEYDTLEEALKEFKSLDTILYIVDSETYVLGKYTNVIAESEEEKNIIDLETLRYI